MANDDGRSTPSARSPSGSAPIGTARVFEHAGWKRALRQLDAVDTQALRRLTEPTIDVTALRRLTEPTIDVTALQNLTASTAASLVNQLARDFLDRNLTRRPALIRHEVLSDLVATATDLVDGAVDVNRSLELAASRAGRQSPPIGADGLLTADGVALTEWIRAVFMQVLEATGLSERDLLEDAVAGCVYVVTFTLVLALLLQHPVLATIAGLSGVAAHPPSAYLARLSRGTFRRLNEL